MSVETFEISSKIGPKNANHDIHTFPTISPILEQEIIAEMSLKIWQTFPFFSKKNCWVLRNWASSQELSSR